MPTLCQWNILKHFAIKVEGLQGIPCQAAFCPQKAMLAGIVQICSPSGSNGYDIPKKSIKKQPAFLQTANGGNGSGYYTLNYYNLKYKTTFLVSYSFYA